MIRTRTLARTVLALAAALAPQARAAAAPAAHPFGHTASATLVAHQNPQRTISLLLQLPFKDAATAAQFALAVSTPGHKLYEHFLTPAEFANRFGPPATATAALRAWATAAGLNPEPATGANTIVPVHGTVAAIEAAFGIRINSYRAPDGRLFFSADAAPALPPALTALSATVAGLDGYARPTPLVRRAPLAAGPRSGGGTGPGGTFAPADLRTAYGIPAPLAGGLPQIVAIFEAGGFDMRDVTTYETYFHIAPAKIHVRNVGGFPGGITDPNVALEAVLDIDMIRATNPRAEIIVYQDGNESASFGVDLATALAAIADEGRAQTVSISYGENEGGDDAEDQVLVELAAQGQAVFASAGDQGAYGDGSTGGYAVLHPASNPFVTGVGGTSLFTFGDQSYGIEDTWNLLQAGHGATGGGISTIWPIPAWQAPAGNSVATANGGSATMRNVPDVAALANPYTGVAVYVTADGGWVQVGGTSVGAPVWAGFYSLLDAAHISLGLGAMGFLAPALYADEINFPDYDTHDITSGTNGIGTAGFAAGYQYDNVTGWGSMIGPQFLYAFLTNPVDTTTKKPDPVRDVQATTTTTTGTLTWRAVTNATGYILEEQLYNPNSPPDIVTPLQIAVTTGTTATIAHLQPATAYTFRINAVNRGGETRGPIAIVTTAGK